MIFSETTPPTPPRYQTSPDTSSVEQAGGKDGISSSPEPPLPGSRIISLNRKILTRSSTNIVRMSMRDIVIEATRAIYQCCSHKDELPRDVYSRILSTLQSDDGEAIGGASSDSDWSDGSMWRQILEGGESRTRRSTILNMLEYMGVWEWYDRQVKLTQAKHEAEHKKPLVRKTASSYVLKDLRNLKTAGKSIKGVGRLTLEEGENIPPENGEPNEITKKEREKIRTQLGRGHKLKDILVKELGLGILFSPGIW